MKILRVKILLAAWLLAGCATSGGPAPPVVPSYAPAPSVTYSPVPLPNPSLPTAVANDDERYYRSCAEAKQAGVVPLRRGDPGYRTGLDQDGDGIACDR